ncbi:MAG: response regulator [Pseudomonadota bacterium]
MKAYTILMLEDEPLILLDLELAAEDRGCIALTASCCEEAQRLIAQHGRDIDVAILDVSLGEGKTCFPITHQLDQQKIPYILHSGDLDRHDEHIREIAAELVAKPAAAEKVIAAAVIHSEGSDPADQKLAAE